VIAGAGPGLGVAIAERYAQEGFAAFLLCRRPGRLKARISRLRARELSVVTLKCDVADVLSVESALRRVRHTAGGCDVLVYNAFASHSGSLSTLDAETILSDFQVNVAAALSFVNLTVGEMRARGGAILFSGCGLARTPSQAETSLSLSKAALRVLVDCLAEEVEGDGIRVGVVTVEGAMPAHAEGLKRVADLYWRLFIASESHRKRELRFRNGRSRR
jgi:short-subunit dehydrogenase